MKSLEEKIEEISNLIDLGNLEEAQVMLNPILEQNPDDLCVRRQQMRIYKRLGKWIDLEILASETLRLFPEDLRTAGQLINAYIAQNKLQKAEIFAKKMLQKNQDDRILRNQLITIYKNLGNWYKVEQIAKQILDLDPNNLPARYQLMAIYKFQKRWDELGLLAHEVQSIDPDNVKCRKYLKYYNRDFQIPKTEEDNVPKMNPMQLFRQRLYNGEITHENLNSSLNELSDLTDIKKAMLLAEVYTHFNIPENATRYLKQALKLKGITEKEEKVLKKALDLVKSTKSNPIIKRKGFEGLHIKEDR